MSVKIVLRKDKINKNGEGPLFLRITENRASSFLSLNVHVRPEYWDVDNELVNQEIRDAEDINSYLRRKKHEAVDMVNQIKREQGRKHPRKIKNLLKYIGGVNFMDYADKFLKQVERSGNLLTFKNYRSSLKKFNDFLHDDDITLDHINVSVLERYVHYLEYECGNSKNTIYNKLKVIRKLFYTAVNEGVISYDQNPFLEFKLKREEKSKDYLTETELWQIERISYGRTSSQEHIRKMFLFSCYSGLKISDIQNLKWGHFENNRITIQVGNRAFTIKLINKALQILNMFQFSQEKYVGSHIFPSYSTTYINKNLKIIAQDTGIQKNLKFSTGRNTFIILALKKGIRLDQIARLLGIKNLKTIEEYTKFIHDDLDMVVGKLNREFL